MSQPTNQPTREPEFEHEPESDPQSHIIKQVKRVVSGLIFPTCQSTTRIIIWVVYGLMHSNLSTRTQHDCHHNYM